MAKAANVKDAGGKITQVLGAVVDVVFDGDICASFRFARRAYFICSIVGGGFLHVDARRPRHFARAKGSGR